MLKFNGLQLNLVLLLVIFMAANSKVSHGTEVAIGLQRYVPLNQHVEFDGLLFAAKYDIKQHWQLFADFEFLQEEVDNNDFTLSRQLWGVSYHFNWPIALQWTLSLGGHHQQLDFDGVEFDSEENDSSFLAQLESEYAISDNHYAGLRFRYYQIFDNDRYDIGLSYQYQLNHHWRLRLLTELGYDNKFNHDTNRYNIEAHFRF
ncbi:hypothetical protein E2K93_11700 [Thalassotalea sp. HSM 43]|uniref:outer membrane beta-barrel protein n=1 Tax=Thalassotalea sp. HSM 43 TaxID=2552945 RepID=UPI001080BFD6|nr:outer membrane beta-barrel protein [Thalassotalea sp. HSM 43]QBY05007.1 hypothetical protein E2K93_11700 [Thalassotalea sp. HSM 43]